MKIYDAETMHLIAQISWTVNSLMTISTLITTKSWHTALHGVNSQQYILLILKVS